MRIPQNSENKPRGFYFSRALFEGLIFGRAYRRGLSTEGNLCFKIDRANLIVGRKFTVFALFFLYLKAISKYKLPEGLIFRGAIQRRVFCVTSLGDLYLEGLIHGGAYFRNFTVPIERAPLN